MPKKIQAIDFMYYVATPEFMERWDRAKEGELICRMGVEPEVTFTGGVARNTGMIEALNKGLNLKVNVSADSHFMGALGAALFALDHIHSSRVPVR